MREQADERETRGDEVLIAGDADAVLDPLFERARGNPPTAAELAWFLRGVPRARRGRWVTRAVGTVLASAAVIGLAVVLLVPAAPPAFAWERVIAAMEAAPVVHTIKNGDEFWVRVHHFMAARRNGGAFASFTDLEALERWVYDAEHNRIWVANCDANDSLVRGFATHTWEALRERFEVLEEGLDGHEPGELYDVEVRSDMEGDVYVLTARQQTLERAGDVFGVSPPKQVVVDVQTGRLVSVDGVRYAYPETGPRGLADLGVPQDAPVVDGRAPELLPLREQVLAAMAEDLGDHRVVVVSNQSWRGWARTTVVGTQVRVEFFQRPEDIPQDPQVLRALARQMLTDEEPDLRRQALRVCDGTVERATFFDDNGDVAGQSMRTSRASHVWHSTLGGYVWYRSPRFFFGSARYRHDELLGPDDAGLIGHRMILQGDAMDRPSMREYWFDPQRGYRLARTRSIDDPNAAWQVLEGWREAYREHVTILVRPKVEDPPDGGESRVIEWAELRPGQWYPAIREGRELEQRADGTWVPTGEPAYTVIVAEPIEDGEWP